MAEEEKRVVVVGGYLPVWSNMLHNTTSIRQHLVAVHGLKREDVYKLKDYECWECHDRLHEAELGGTLING